MFAAWAMVYVGYELGLIEGLHHTIIIAQHTLTLLLLLERLRRRQVAAHAGGEADLAVIDVQVQPH